MPLLSDGWAGIEEFFTPGEEILRVDKAEEVLQTLSLSDAELRRIAEAARTRVLAEHTADCRVRDLENALDAVRSRATGVTVAV